LLRGAVAEQLHSLTTNSFDPNSKQNFKAKGIRYVFAFRFQDKSGRTHQIRKGGEGKVKSAGLRRGRGGTRKNSIRNNASICGRYTDVY
jgi:hypothetical protein